MLRPLFALALAGLLAIPVAVSAQNPFLENQGQRTIRSIRFEGQERTRLYVLERELGFSVGDEYDPVQLNDAWARLEQLPFIAYVEIEVDRPGPTEAELLIKVEEEGIFRWQVGVEYARRLDPRWYGDLRLGAVNALGRGDVTELQLNAWALNQARLRWTNPWILGQARLGVFAAVGGFRHDWGYDPAPDARHGEFAVEAGVSRAFGPGFRAALSGRWRHAELSDIPTDAFGPGTPEEFRADEPSVRLTVGFDNRDSEFYAGRGVLAEAELNRGMPSGDLDDWSTLDLSLSAFAPVPWLDAVGGYLAHRTASTSLPWYERSYLGGPEDLRGVAFGSDSGDERLRASLEVRRTIIELPLRGGRSIGTGVHAFSDWGAAWEHDEDMGDQKLAHSFGLGAHFNFNTFNYRFEWARHDGEDFFVFEDHFTF